MQFSLFVTKAKQQVGGKNQIDKVPQFSVSLKKKKKVDSKKGGVHKTCTCGISKQISNWGNQRNYKYKQL